MERLEGVPFRAVRSVSPAMLDNADMRQLFERWECLATRSIPRVSDISLDESWLADRVALVERLEDGSFAYRHFGIRLGQTVGKSMTGRTTHDLSARNSRFVVKVYDMVLAEALPLYAIHDTVENKTVLQWERLMLPLAADDGDVRFVLAVLGPRGLRHELLEHLVEANPDPVIALGGIDPAHPGRVVPRILLANEAACDLCGTQQGEMVEQPLHTIAPWMLAEGVGELLVAACQDGRSDRREVRLSPPNRTGSIWYQVTTTPVAGGCALTLTDLSRGSAERQREQGLAAVLAGVPIPMLVTEVGSGRIVYANQTATLRFGRRLEDGGEVFASEIYETASDHDVLLRELARHGQVDGFETRLKDGSGEGFWAMLGTRLQRMEGIDVAVTAITDIDARYAMESELRRLATTDELTAISNRSHFLTLLGREIDRTRRTGRPLSLVLIDVDRFKQVNDQFGHPVGDQVLVNLSRRLAEHLRTMDTFGRLGGEEFAILLPECGLDGAKNLAERLRESLAATPLGVSGDRVPAAGLPVTASFGVTPFNGEGDDAEAMLHRADLALYAAKDAGRNRVVGMMGR